MAALFTLVVFANVGAKSAIVHRRMELVRHAAIAFREANGSYPASIGELVPKFLDSRPGEMILQTSDDSLNIQSLDVFGRIEEECSNGDCEPPPPDEDEEEGAAAEEQQDEPVEQPGA